jgi:hypothetical protein
MRHRKTVVLLGLMASAVFMYLAVRRLDFASLRAVFASTQLFPWIPLGILSYVAGHVVRGMRCRLLVRREANLRLVTASNIVVVGYAANNVFPARLGELVRAGMLAERTGIPVAQSLMVTFIERVLDGLAILLLLVIGTTQGQAPEWTHQLVRVALLVFGGACGVMMLAVSSPGLVLSGASRLGNKLGTKWHDRLVGLATSITNAGACLRDPADAILIVVYSVVVWVLETGLFVAILPMFGIAPSFTAGAVAMSVTNLGLLVPSSPGFVGPFHFFCSRALMTKGIDEPTALAYAAVVHLAFYIPVTLWGAAAMLWYGVEVGATAALTRKAREAGKTTTVNGLVIHELAPVAAARADVPASAFTLTLVESVVIAEGQKAEAKALRDAADFVHNQLDALPPQLKVMFEAGMSFFRFVTRLRYLRGFCELSLETRQKWTRAWAESRYALFRKLMKPVRATALLAYNDHPLVRKTLVGEARPAVVAAADLVRDKDKEKEKRPSRPSSPGVEAVE